MHGPARPLAWNRRVVDILGNAGNACELHGDVLDYLAAELNWNAANLHIGNRKRRACGRREYGSEGVCGSPSKDLKPPRDRQAAGQTEASVVEMINVQSYRICQRNHTALAREAIHPCADSGIAIPTRIAESSASGEGNGGGDLVAGRVL